MVHRQQRDKYMAFALAAADLLIEVTQDGRILEITGAVQALTGTPPQDLVGQALDGLFVGTDSALLRRLRSRAVELGRIQPTVLRLKYDRGQPISVTVGICCLPGHVNQCFTVSVLSEGLAAKLPKRDDISGLVAMSEFQHMAERGISPNDPGSGAAMLKEMRLVKIGGFDTGLASLSETRANALLSEIGAILNANAGEAIATRLGGDSFGLMGQADDGNDTEGLAESLEATLRAAGLDSKSVRPQIMTVSLAADGLNAQEATKALAYIFANLSKKEFVAPRSLGTAFADAERDVVKQLSDLRKVIDEKRFELHLQPVVEFRTGAVAHYEALIRFGKYNKPFETIRFAEHVGIIPDLDLAVCEQAIRLLEANAHISLAVNLSGVSVQNVEFCDRLNALLHAHHGLAGRLLFELTESYQIDNLEKAARFLADIRRKGYKVCLDDFGSGASAYNYLRTFEVDYLKIDGAFLHRAATDRREKALLRSIAVLCTELGCQAIAEMIETPEIMSLARDLGLSFGQGYLFGKPSADIPQPRAIPANARRMGNTIGWQ